MTTVADHARALIGATSLAGKLAPAPPGLIDRLPIPGPLPSAPGRPPELAPVAGARARVPPLEGMADPAQRRRILHGFANHELQAVELFARALLAFDEAPAAFREGLLGILADEQRHLALYVERLEQLGGRFGEHPVSAYFWNKLDHLATPLSFVAAMCLTFENANLDHTLDHAEAARAAGDEATAAVLERVHRDERRHVAFGLRWLVELSPAGADPARTWTDQLRWPLRPALARGPRLHADVRRELGFDPGLLDLLERS